MPALYERLGGEAAINAAVDIFYGKVLADPSREKFFVGKDTEQLAKHQKAFLTMAFGGPTNYTGRGLNAAHAKLVADGLNDEHFGSVAGHLQATLEELSVPADMITEVMTIAASTQEAVLGRAED